MLEVWVDNSSTILTASALPILMRVFIISVTITKSWQFLATIEGLGTAFSNRRLPMIQMTRCKVRCSGWSRVRISFSWKFNAENEDHSFPHTALSRHPSRCRSYGRLQDGKRFPGRRLPPPLTLCTLRRTRATLQGCFCKAKVLPYIKR